MEFKFYYGLKRVIISSARENQQQNSAHLAELYRARKGVVGQTFFRKKKGGPAKVRAIPTGNSVWQHSGSRQSVLLF